MRGAEELTCVYRKEGLVPERYQKESCTYNLRYFEAKY